MRVRVRVREVTVRRIVKVGEDYGLRVTGYGLRVTGYGLRITGYGLRVTG